MNSGLSDLTLLRATALLGVAPHAQLEIVEHFQIVVYTASASRQIIADHHAGSAGHEDHRLHVTEKLAATGQPFYVVTKSPLVLRDAGYFRGRDDRFIAVSLNTVEDLVALGDEAVDHAVEAEAVVEPRPDESLELADGCRCEQRVQLDRKVAGRGFHEHQTVRVHFTPDGPVRRDGAAAGHAAEEEYSQEPDSE